MDIFHKVCDAIAFAHSKGILHRDLKPENIMVGEFGEVLVMDWGLAKLLRGHDEGQTTNDTGGETGQGLGATLMGSVMGTPRCAVCFPTPAGIGSWFRRRTPRALMVWISHMIVG